MPTGVLKVRVGGVWQNIGSAGMYAHHTLHEPGGADAIAVLDAGILTQGTLPDARLSANVLKYPGGFPGGTINFLRADGTFAPAGVGNVTGPGNSIANNLAMFADTTGKAIIDSSIPFAQVARLDGSPTFVGTVTANSLMAASSSWGSLWLKHTSAPADQKNYQIYYANGLLVLRSLNDATTTQLGYATLDYLGNFATALDISAHGAVKIGAPDGSWPGMMFYNSFFTISHNTGGQLGWWNSAGIFNLNMGNFRFGSSLLSIQNGTGTTVMSVRSDGAVSCPYYLVIPFGTDKWAPA